MNFSGKVLPQSLREEVLHLVPILYSEKPLTRHLTLLINSKKDFQTVSILVLSKKMEPDG